jgi:hypothetical protein
MKGSDRGLSEGTVPVFALRGRRKIQLSYDCRLQSKVWDPESPEYESGVASGQSMGPGIT